MSTEEQTWKDEWPKLKNAQPPDGEGIRVALIDLTADQIVGLLNGSLKVTGMPQTIDKFYRASNGSPLWMSPDEHGRAKEGYSVQLAVVSLELALVPNGGLMPHLDLKFSE